MAYWNLRVDLPNKRELDFDTDTLEQMKNLVKKRKDIQNKKAILQKVAKGDRFGDKIVNYMTINTSNLLYENFRVR